MTGDRLIFLTRADRFLARLTHGWSLPFVVEPASGNGQAIALEWCGACAVAEQNGGMQ